MVDIESEGDSFSNWEVLSIRTILGLAFLGGGVVSTVGTGGLCRTGLVGMAISIARDLVACTDMEGCNAVTKSRILG